MTSKNSCFDRAIFRRSLRRTAPVWGLFCLYELLLPLRLYSYCRGVSVCTEDFFVQAERTILENAVTGASVVPFVYGGLLAWALFSWLFRTNSAYFYAALPVRRRTLFLTNYLTGLLLCAAPALVSSLLLWAVGAGFGVSAFLPAMQVFAATAMGFLLFFSFASLVCMVVGQMAAAPLVYGMLNFAAYVLESIVQHLMQTFVYGMPASQTTAAERAAAYASPVFGLLRGGFRVATEWVDAGAVGYETDPHLVGWGYLGILAGVGVVFAVCAYLLLQHREMERSGDVIAVRQLRPAALYGFTIGCALVIGVLLVELLSGNAADNFWYVLLFLTVGAFVGYFTGKMLLQKTVFVFRSGWGGFAACCLVLAVVFGAAKFDLFGYSRYLPQRSRIAAAGLTRNEYQGLYTSRDPAFIDRVLALHTAAVEEKPRQEQRKTDYQRGTDQTQGFYISYRLTDGRFLQRYYSVVYNEADALASGSLISQFSSVYNSPDCVRIRTGFDTPRTEANVCVFQRVGRGSGADRRACVGALCGLSGGYQCGPARRGGRQRRRDEGRRGLHAALPDVHRHDQHPG